MQRKREEEEQRKRELEEKKQQELEWRKRYTHQVYSGTLLIQASEMQPPRQWLWHGLIDLYNNIINLP